MATDRTNLLVLWDIDHTLIETRGVGTQLYRQAFEAVTGQRMTHEVDPTGRTELAIFADTIAAHGIAPSDELQAQYAEELARQYDANVELLRSRGRVLPGAVEALAALAREPGVIQTVLTGNLRAVALTKLRVFGLSERIDIEVGAYGEDDSERAKLVPVTQARATAKYGERFERGNTAIVGDTTSDVVAAHDGGAQIVGVASGRDSQDVLREAGAEVVLPDLTDTARVVRLIMEELPSRS